MASRKENLRETMTRQEKGKQSPKAQPWTHASGLTLNERQGRRGLAVQTRQMDTKSTPGSVFVSFSSKATEPLSSGESCLSALVLLAKDHKHLGFRRI